MQHRCGVVEHLVQRRADGEGGGVEVAGGGDDGIGLRTGQARADELVLDHLEHRSAVRGDSGRRAHVRGEGAVRADLGDELVQGQASAAACGSSEHGLDQQVGQGREVRDVAAEQDAAVGERAGLGGADAGVGQSNPAAGKCAVGIGSTRDTGTIGAGHVDGRIGQRSAASGRAVDGDFRACTAAAATTAAATCSQTEKGYGRNQELGACRLREVCHRVFRSVRTGGTRCAKRAGRN